VEEEEGREDGKGSTAAVGADSTSRWPLLVRRRTSCLPLYVWIQKNRERERTRHREESREIRERFVDSFHCYSEGKEQGQYSHSMRLKIVGENADMDVFKYSEL
jgi:hypothetical protein